MIVCVLLPRFELAVATGGREALAEGPVALAPPPGREPRIGEISGAAEAFGLYAGMLLGEALTRCPELALVAPDPIRVAQAWEGILRSLEGIGAAVETERAGVAYFDGQRLMGLHSSGGRVVAATRRALPHPARLGAGPTRFCALAAASRARPRRPVVVTGGRSAAREYLATHPLALLRFRAAAASVVEPLERLGVRTLGQLAQLPRDAMVDRFGAAGLLAHRLARGEDDPLHPRQVGETLVESLELPDSASGPQLQRALAALIDRLLARPERRERTLRTVVVAASLAAGGTWRERVTFREALSDPERIRVALLPRVELLPAPADVLWLEAEHFGPPAGDQRALLDEGVARRQARLREAVRQARASAGPDAALRVVSVDPRSRVPERRAILAPFEA
jgi:protein ImuB